MNIVTNLRKKIAYASVAIAVLLIMVILVGGGLNNREAYKDALILDSGWDVSFNDGQEYNNVSLSELQFPTTNKGDIITLSTRIGQCDIEDPVVMFVLYHVAYQIYLDDELVAEYAVEEVERGEQIGSGYHWVNLPGNLSGKELKIVAKYNEYNVQSSVEPLIISNATDTTKYYISDNFTNITVGVFLVVFGICLILAAILLMIFSRQSVMLIYTGSFSFLIGLWFICNKGIINLVSDNRMLNLWCEYFALYLAPVPILLYMLYLRRKTEKKWQVMPMKVMLIINLGLVALTLILQFTGVTHFSNVLTCYHVLFLAVILFIVFTNIYNLIKDPRIEENVLLVGVAGLSLCVGLDIIIFNISKYMDRKLTKMVGISSWGSLLFIISMLFSFGLNVYRSVSYNVEQATLMSLAYKDPLTQLFNRAKFMMVLGDYVKEDLKYTIINFDLNNLKGTNDTFGHQVGDKMLLDFAKVLTDSFDKADIVSRVGGDEFYVLIRRCNRIHIEENMKKYQRNIEAINTEEKIYKVEAAWGIAFSDEVPAGKFEEVIKMADERMYVRKAEMKAPEGAD